MVRPGVAVIGGGAWGLALAAAASRTASDGGVTLLYSRREFGPLPSGITQTRNYAEIGARARLIFVAVPSDHAREVLRSLGDHIDGSHYVVHGVRGLAGDSMETIGDLIRAETPARRIGALGGPALAEDLLAGRPSVIVCGSHYPEVNAAVARVFVTPQLRLYATDDLRGLEWASALVGCIAIGVGFAQGMGLGPGLTAAAIVRSVEEASRLAAAAGGEGRTLLGLAGYGDLLASVSQTERPEVALGRALAKGDTLDEALRGSRQRVEAVELIPRVIAWAARHGVRIPMFDALTRGVLSARSREVIVQGLMDSSSDSRA